MALTNRVTPFGDIVGSSARGLLMGNRGGRLHDPASRAMSGRSWASRQWIACRLDVSGRRREVMGEGYTELFFLDEATALSAGHRPCFECRRAEARAFADALARGLRLERRPRAAEVDRLLHAERLDGRAKRVHTAEIATLPDGAMIAIDGAAYAVQGDDLLHWSLGGYGARRPRPGAGAVALLTPPVAVTALAFGYAPLWHASAG